MRNPLTYLTLLVVLCGFVVLGQSPALVNLASASTKPPEGTVEMHVVDVVSAEDGEINAVLLMPESQDVLLPVFMNLEDAVGIAARMKDEAPPLKGSAEMFEGFLAGFGSKVNRVVLDEVVPSSLNGHLFVTRGDNELQLPGRGCDLIALAIAHNVPIYVTKDVADMVGLTEQDIDSIRERSEEGPGIGGSGALPPGHPPVDEEPALPEAPKPQPGEGALSL
ncbi:MAG: bifunctional nuclease family protein [Myxococcales bacterium]